MQKLKPEYATSSRIKNQCSAPDHSLTVSLEIRSIIMIKLVSYVALRSIIMIKLASFDGYYDYDYYDDYDHYYYEYYYYYYY